MKEISLKTEKLPAFCAHRGVSGLMPENSLPAFGAALALGADEIELDVWLTKNGQLVVSHDVTLDRISDGTGKVSDYTLEELKKFNIGVKLGWEVGFCSMEEVFAQFANRIIMNIHLKEAGPNGEVVKQLAEMAERYDAVDSIYLAAGEQILPAIAEFAPHIARDAIQFPDTEDIYKIAVEYKCQRVQFWLGMFDEELIRRLHDAGIICNLFYADTKENMEKYFQMGVDVLLTNRMDLARQYIDAK